MGLISSKKGEQGIKMITIACWVFVIVSLVFFVYQLNEINKLNEDKMVEKMAVSRDIAMLMNAMIASPGDVIYEYPMDTYWFNYRIDRNKVLVYDRTGKTSRGQYSYRFTEDAGVKIRYDEFSAAKTRLEPVFKKEGNWLWIEQLGEEYEPECQDVSSDVGFRTGYTFQYAVIQDIDMLADEGKGREIEDEIRSHESENPVALIIAGKETESNYIKIIMSSREERLDERRRLACLIRNSVAVNKNINEFFEQKGRDKPGIIIDETALHDILTVTDFAFIIEISGFDIDKDSSIVNAFKESFEQGIKDYG